MSGPNIPAGSDSSVPAGARDLGSGSSWLSAWLPAGMFLIGITGWYLLANSGNVSLLILPDPRDVALAFADITWGSGLVWTHVRVTVTEALTGFLLGSSAAAVIAVSAALSQTFKKMVYPFMVAFQVTPRIAIAPIIIAWLGFGQTPKIVIGATICFFPVFLNMLTGLLSADAGTMEMFRSLGASKWKVFTHLMLPSAMPFTLAGLQTGASFALIGAIVGEFISASEGLGYLINSFSFQLNIAASYAVLLWLTLLGLMFFGLMKTTNRFVVFWERDDGLTARSRRQTRRAVRHGLVSDPSDTHDLAHSGPEPELMDKGERE